MKHLELDIPEKAHRILKKHSKISGKSIEKIAIEKILVQLESEIETYQLSRTVQSLKEITDPLSKDVLALISNPKTKRETIYKQLSQRQLGKPLSEIIIEERDC